MSIKYSEILASDEVFSAGNNDIIVIAIVDGGSPTGYTTKAIKKSNLITGGGGDVATDPIWDANLDLAVGTGPDTAVRLAGGTALQVLRVNAAGTSLEWATPGGADGNGIYDGSGSLTVPTIVTLTQTNNLSFNGAVTTFKGSNDSVGASTIIAQNNSNVKTFQVKNDGSIVAGKDIGGAQNHTFSFKTSNYSGMFAIEDEAGNDYFTFKAGQITMHSNNSIVGGNLSEIRLASINNVWNTTIRANYNGHYYLSHRNTSENVNVFYTSSTLNKGYTHLGIVGNNPGLKIGGGATAHNTALSLDVRDNSNVALLNVTRATGNVAIGQVGGAGKLNVTGGDVFFEGDSDLNLFSLGYLTNQLAIGSTPYANVKASITNTGAETYSFLVLNSDTTKEFGVLQSGEIKMSNCQLNIGSALIGSEYAIIGGQTIINATALADQFYYTGDGGTSKGFSIGQSISRGNHLYMENTGGVEFAVIKSVGDSFINSTTAGASLIIGKSTTVGSGAKLQVDVKISDGAIPSALFSNDNNNLIVLNTTNDNSGFGTQTPDASAVVDFTSTKGGILIPRMTGAQASAIATPADGLILYITVVDATFGVVGFWKRDNGAWVQF